MKLRQLWISHFKNLSNFEIRFDEDDEDLTTVILGGNGTGKSNLLEALAVIFRDLDLVNRTTFEYYLAYECRGHHIEIDANPSQDRSPHFSQLLLLNEEPEERKRRGRLQIKVDRKNVTMSHFYENKGEYLPTHVFGYY